VRRHGAVRAEGSSHARRNEQQCDSPNRPVKTKSLAASQRRVAHVQTGLLNELVVVTFVQRVEVLVLPACLAAVRQYPLSVSMFVTNVEMLTPLCGFGRIECCVTHPSYCLNQLEKHVIAPTPDQPPSGADLADGSIAVNCTGHPNPRAGPSRSVCVRPVPALGRTRNALRRPSTC
jgi:hypothetical protein